MVDYSPKFRRREEGPADVHYPTSVPRLWSMYCQKDVRDYLRTWTRAEEVLLERTLSPVAMIARPKSRLFISHLCAPGPLSSLVRRGGAGLDGVPHTYQHPWLQMAL